MIIKVKMKMFNQTFDTVCEFLVNGGIRIWRIFIEKCYNIGVQSDKKNENDP